MPDTHDRGKGIRVIMRRLVDLETTYLNAQDALRVACVEAEEALNELRIGLEADTDLLERATKRLGE